MGSPGHARLRNRLAAAAGRVTALVGGRLAESRAATVKLRSLSPPIRPRP
jgi:hypothetical protein